MRKVILVLMLVLIPTSFYIPSLLMYLQAGEKLSAEVFTWDCEYPEQKPEAITLTCGDGGQYIDEITWDVWGASGAQGTGVYHVNDCDPSCAEGNFLSAPVTIELSDLERYQGESYLRTMTFETTGGENLPNSGQSFYQWDVMEFAEMMAE